MEMVIRKTTTSSAKALMVGGLCLAIAGCATHIPVNREVGALDFNYEPASTNKPVGKPVAIVSPQFVAAENNAPTRAENPLLIAQLRAMQGGSQFQPQMVYQSAYKTRISDSMMASIQEILSKKGFTTKGPYATFDDIPFGDKKTIYLVAMPSLKIYFDQKPEQLSCRGMVCTDRGVFNVSGELVYKMIEPLTGQALMTKRVNLSDFGITKSYIREFQNRTHSDGLVGTAIDKAMNPEQLRDNTDRVMAEALNEFFKKSMAKVDMFVSTEELLSFQSDIDQLKGLKRF